MFYCIPGTGPSVSPRSSALCRTVQGTPALLVCYTRKQEPVTYTAGSTNTYGDTQPVAAPACPLQGATVGPFHQGLTPGSTVTPSAFLKTLRARGVTQHTALMAEPDCLLRGAAGGLRPHWVWMAAVPPFLSLWGGKGDCTGKPRHQPTEQSPSGRAHNRAVEK